MYSPRLWRCIAISAATSSSSIREFCGVPFFEHGRASRSLINALPTFGGSWPVLVCSAESEWHAVTRPSSDCHSHHFHILTLCLCICEGSLQPIQVGYEAAEVNGIAYSLHGLLVAGA